MWTTATRPQAERVLQRLRWQDLRLVRQSSPGAMVRAAHDVSWAQGLQSDDEPLVYVSRPRQDASLTLRLPGSMGGSLVDPDSGEDIQSVRIDSRPWEIKRLNLPPRGAVVVVLRRLD